MCQGTLLEILGATQCAKWAECAQLPQVVRFATSLFHDAFSLQLVSEGANFSLLGWVDMLSAIILTGSGGK